MALWDSTAAQLAELHAELGEALGALAAAEDAAVMPNGRFRAAHDALCALLQKRRSGELIEPGTIQAAYDARLHAGVARYPYQQAVRTARSWHRAVRLEVLLAEAAARREAQKQKKPAPEHIGAETKPPLPDAAQLALDLTTD